MTDFCGRGEQHGQNPRSQQAYKAAKLFREWVEALTARPTIKLE